MLDQQARIGGRAGRTLGRFRILVTDDPRAAEAATAPSTIWDLLNIARDQRTAEQAEAIAAYYRALDPELVKLAAKRADLERRLSEARLDKTPIMVELAPDKQRTTHVLARGSFLSPEEEVKPDTPEAFPPFPTDAPRNRLGLARWLVCRENPLTARVVANCQWEELFGACMFSITETVILEQAGAKSL